MSENEEARQKINSNNKSKLINTDFSLLASNCNGAFILHDLGMRFNSPTVNLYMYPKDFIKYVKHLKYYSNIDLKFIEEDNIPFPIGMLDDIKIYFMHYKTKDEAKDKWVERTKRINYDNIFIMMTERDSCTYEDLVEFDNLPYDNKVVFTHIPYPDIKSSAYIKGFENESELGFIYEFKDEKSGIKYYDDFDYVSWFNNGEIKE